MDIDVNNLKDKLFSWIQAQHDEQCCEEDHRQLEGMEFFVFGFGLLGNKLLDDLEQVMVWAHRGAFAIVKIALILMVIATVLFLLSQIGVRLIHGFHIP